MSKLVENYLLQQPIGKGVYGQVYKAIHQKNKQLFAVKVIPKASFRSNPKLQQLAINQINILSSLKHQNIVRFIQTLKTPNNFYFVYEFCNDGTIQNMLQKKRFLKQNQALIIFRQLLQAFKELNKNNIMHRDLKPDNIFLSNGKVKLGDFGFCKMLQVNMAQTMLGSPIYMAPQILREQIYTSKADIWSLGVVLFELLFGYCPYQSSSISQLINVIKQNELVIPNQINCISQKTDGLLRKMLVKDQFKRIEWVDLFEYKIDEWGNIISGYNKQMGIQALQKYFLNDVRSAGEIVVQQNSNNNQMMNNNAVSVNPYLQFKSQQIGSQKQAVNNNSHRKQQNYVPSLKKTNSTVNDNYGNTNPLLKSQSLGRAGPGLNIINNIPQVKQFTFKNQQITVQNKSLHKRQSSQQFNQIRQNNNLNTSNNVNNLNNNLNNLNSNLSNNNTKQQSSTISNNSNQISFLQKHNTWTQALQIIQELNQKSALENDKCIYWVANSLLDKLTLQYKNYPQWTDVIMQQKQLLISIIKQLQHIQINKNHDIKNQILKLWTKNNLKNNNTWEKAIKFIFSQNKNTHKSIEDILLS